MIIIEPCLKSGNSFSQIKITALQTIVETLKLLVILRSIEHIQWSGSLGKRELVTSMWCTFNYNAKLFLEYVWVSLYKTSFVSSKLKGAIHHKHKENKPRDILWGMLKYKPKFASNI